MYNSEIALMLGSEFVNIPDSQSADSFMSGGYTIEDMWSWSPPIKGYPIINGVSESASWQAGNFKFKTDANWLFYALEIVEKEFKGFKYILKNDSFEIFYMDYNESTYKNNSIPEMIYNGLGKFAIWYNNQK
jgi:hypothetical protein